MNNPHQLNGHDGHQSGEIAVRPRNAYAVDSPMYPAPAGPAEETESDLSVLLQYFWILWKHKFVLILTLVLGVLGALIISLLVTPLYRAKTSLEIQKIQEPFGASIVTADPTVPTQTQLLISATMRNRALSKL